MKPGSIVLCRVQQSDGRLKIRPAVVLAQMPPFQDLLICAISSQVRHEVAGFDELVLSGTPEFVQSGLKVDSLIRLGLLATVPPSAVAGTLGSITTARLVRLLERLTTYLNPPAAENPGS